MPSRFGRRVEKMRHATVRSYWRRNYSHQEVLQRQRDHSNDLDEGRGDFLPRAGRRNHEGRS